MMPTTESAHRPNILLIHTDQWRRDAMGCLGNPHVLTPHLDQLAKWGVNFSRAYAAVPSCIASRASLLTGLRPASHGRVGYRDRVRWEYPETLGSVFSEAGYHTHAVGKMHVWPVRNLVGFNSVELHDGYMGTSRMSGCDPATYDDYMPWLRDRLGAEADHIDSGMGCNGYAVAPWPHDSMLHPTAWTATRSIDFLRRRDPTKPFLLYTSFHRPHPPLDPPNDYLDMYRDAEMPPPFRADWEDEVRGPDDDYYFHDSPWPRSARAIDLARRAYYAQITFIDHQINRIIMTLNEIGQLHNTVIVFTSDHGEMIYDYGLAAKSFPYECSAGTPLIVRLPTGCDGPTGVTIDAPVEQRDILPTLCDAAGVTIPESIEGRSLLPFCRGETPAWRPWVHLEHANYSHYHALSNGHRKYVWFSQTGYEQFFDLDADPTESTNLAARRTDEIADWRAALVAELADREEGFVRDGKLVVGAEHGEILSFMRNMEESC